MPINADKPHLWKADVEESIDFYNDRTATVVADRLCGAMADPIIRNAQESRQLNAIQHWLESKGYRHISAKEFDDLKEMPAGTFTFRMNVSVGKGKRKINIPIDALIQPIHADNTVPVFVEAKSAGDATNTNKRRKEEAQKYSQLKKEFGKWSFRPVQKPIFSKSKPS